MSSLLSEFANPQKAVNLARFFKTGVGEYGEGDQFLGVTVPQTRAVAKQNLHLHLSEIELLLHSKWHEERLLALHILTYQFPKATPIHQKKLFDFYLAQTKYINNWDLVDTSAHKIVGAYLLKNMNQIDILDSLAHSKNMWQQRIAIIATFAFIAQNNVEPSLHLAEILISHPHDLMHKAVGWVLREVWKKTPSKAEEFLIQHYQGISRTTLRYAIERMDEQKRKQFLNGTFA